MTGSERLEPFRERIERILDRVLARVDAVMPISHIDIVVADHPEQAIDETGSGGVAWTRHFVQINLDPMHTWREGAFELELASSVSHELHHAVRLMSWSWPLSLGDSFVTEGLADHFDREINGGDPKPWSIALNAEEARACFIRAQDEFLVAEYDHAAWFFGSEERDIPKWAGYSIGYHLVGDYLSGTDRTAAALVGIDAKEILAHWLP
ncbi:hypothetical protein GVX82_04520 [Patescibacteria group bacterium]|nr:hypothetical protein [Patescibacteria group bacterium]